MRGKTSIAIAIIVAGFSAGFGVASPPIAMPSPSPCCTDGVCHPKRETWGHYHTQWRRWPGDSRPDAPGTGEPSAKGQFPPELSPVEIPRPEIEDRRAPESFKERQRRQEESDKRLQLRPIPGTGGAAQGGFDFDAPPGPPRGGPLGPAPLNGLPNLDNFQLPTGEPQSNLDQHKWDMPPRPPRSVVQYASHMSEPTGLGSSIMVTRASVTKHSNNTTRRLPTSKVQKVGRAVFLKPIANPAR